MSPATPNIRKVILTATIIVSLVSCTSMFVAAIAMNMHTSNAVLKNELENIAAMTAENVKASIAFSDIVETERRIHTLSQIDHILNAQLTQADGQLLAAYKNPHYALTGITRIFSAPITVHHSVSVGNQHLGTLRITSSTGPILEDATNIYAVAALSVLLFSLLIAYVFSQALARKIANPLAKLHNAIDRAARNPDASFQLPIESHNKVSGLYFSFNALLTELTSSKKATEQRAERLGETLDIRNQQISEEEQKRILWLQNLAQFLKHELKNTMLGFRSSLDMIERRSDDAKIHQYIERARNSITFMGKLLHNVGETSGLEAEILAEEFDVIDLCEIITPWLDDYHHITGENTITFDCQSTCIVKGNRVRLLQMLEKLAANAISHRAGDAPVRVGVRQSEHEVVLSVANQGTPLPEERTGIFDLFVSMRESAAQDGDNVGLGLYVVRIIAQAHDGYVTADNLDYTDGAIFSVHLPRYHPPA